VLAERLRLESICECPVPARRPSATRVRNYGLVACARDSRRSAGDRDPPRAAPGQELGNYQVRERTWLMLVRGRCTFEVRPSVR
jgi:hypothetical protein